MLDSIVYDRQEEQANAKHIVKLEDDPMVPMVESMVKAADMRKAASVKVLRVFEMTEVTQFIILVEGYNNRQNQAIALAIEDDVLEQFDVQPFAKEGTATSGWILMDYGSVITHIMTPQMSNFYKLEKKWKGAEVMDLSHILMPDSSSASSDGVGGRASVDQAAEELLDEDAAFWGDDIDEAEISEAAAARKAEDSIVDEFYNEDE